MKRSNNEIQKVKKIIVPILKRHKITSAALFGSFARGEAKAESDIDILIDFSDRKSLFDLSGIKIDLEDALQKKVDVVPERSLYPRLRPYVEKDRYQLY